MRFNRFWRVVLALAGLLLMPGCNGSGGGKPVPKPPSITSLTLKQDYLFSQAPGSAQLTIQVPPTVSYMTVRPGQDCNTPIGANHTWVMESPADYADLTITMQNGIAPGIGNARGFVLTHIAPDGTQTNYDLIMRQSSPATDYLIVESWRLALSVVGNPSSEIGNGGPYAPPVGSPPFPRLFQAPGSGVGNQWIIAPTSPTDVSTMQVVLSLSITNSNLTVCN
jgi:hypothetical protein